MKPKKTIVEVLPLVRVETDGDLTVTTGAREEIVVVDCKCCDSMESMERCEECPLNAPPL